MKVIAFHLPQFHRIPENDSWWGEGFTEWNNVRKAQPLFSEHRQPRRPLDERYYDLTDPATHDWQAETASRNGIHGFCYYHYWFGGKKLLERPAEIILERGKPDFPFCFSWANEPWTRSWDGLESQVLMPQTYGDEAAWRQHYEYLLPFFQDKRYIRLQGEPVFLIYRPKSIPRLADMARSWIKWASSDGLPGLCLVQMLTSFDGQPMRDVFKRQVYFEPMYTMSNDLPTWFKFAKGARVWLRDRALAHGRAFPVLHNRVPYSLIWQQILRRPIDPNIFPGAFVDWDNSPRKGSKAMTCTGATPDNFRTYFRQQYTRHESTGQEFIFTNAWNEWAEGAYLEPDVTYGNGFLDAIASCVSSKS